MKYLLYASLSLPLVGWLLYRRREKIQHAIYHDPNEDSARRRLEALCGIGSETKTYEIPYTRTGKQG